MEKHESKTACKSAAHQGLNRNYIVEKMTIIIINTDIFLYRDDEAKTNDKTASTSSTPVMALEAVSMSTLLLDAHI